MISIVLIDDHPLAINGIGAWLSNTGRFRVIGTAENLKEATALMERLETLPEIIILDISLGQEDGLEFVPILKELCKKKNAKLPGILVCSMFEDPFLIQRAINLGVQAYVAKSAKSEEIMTAIEAIISGNTYVNSKYKINYKEKAWSVLTRRENEIVSLIKQNLNTKQIAKRLGLNPRTVENHLGRIYMKTNTLSRAELLEL